MADGNEITTIPRLRQVYYDTYANLPTTNLRAGDLGFATDRLVLYRWSGSAWQSINFHVSSGVAANIPTAGDLPEGSLYHETDTGKTKQVQSSAWVEITTAVVIASGTYTGDSSNNRAIPHGMGKTPKLVFIIVNQTPYYYWWVLIGDVAGIFYNYDGADGIYGVTALDATNFHVGNSSEYNISGNYTGYTYYWVAIS